ncbi:hypothetical protein BC830DRAFT_857743 [Chytriomyces sp. MP71]|nr:hypothetical protein BC830DRAFT_857743 [Chytriomyces sp. MP71]
MCFMNAILQPLLHCVTFYNLIKQLGLNVAYSFKTNTPLMDAFITFFNEFDEELPHQLSGKTKCRTASDAFEPVYVYDALWKKSNVDSIKGRQEDAEEFLGFLLDGLHEELLFVRRGGKPVVRPSSPDGLTSPTSSDVTGGSSSKDTSGDDAWVEVGRKNKTATTRTTEILETPIVQIFGGRTRSIIKAHGDKERVTLEPFQSLQLDIAPDHVASIDDALLNLTVPETITGVTSQNLGIAVDATKQTYIDVFPSVLILHLKRFVYDQSCGATRKLRKHVAFETRLKVRGDVVAPGARRAGQVVYTLFAVVNHHGKYAEGGHYTCDVYRNNEEWLRMDDENVEKVTVEDVVEEKEDRQAYMLFYAKS